jgi:uncharacterized protein YdeI (YjbR/CyaY-like superfamily)
MAINTVEEYIEKHPDWEEEIVSLREMLLSSELDEAIKWGGPVYTLNGKNVVGIGAFKSHGALWFFQGALLKENTALLQNAQEGKTKALRQIRFEKGELPSLDILRKYVQEAIQNQMEGKEIKPVKNKEVEIPSLLQSSLKKDSNLKKAFLELTPGRQREYCEHIAEAKREATKLNRIEKITPMIKSGQGLHDKYKNC